MQREQTVQSFHEFMEVLLRDPNRLYTTYEQIRQQGELFALDSGYDVITTSHKMINLVLKDSRFIREWRTLVDARKMEETPDYLTIIRNMQEDWMLFRDPPVHTRLRGLVSRAFTPRMVANLEQRIRTIADELLNAAGPEFDAIPSYAFPLPVIVIAELLGVPAEDRHLFRDWSTRIVATLEAGELPEHIARPASEATREISDYFRELIRCRRTHPREDLLSGLIASESAGQALSEDEIIATTVLLLLAGHETTVNLITNGLLLLTNYEDAQAQLRQNLSLIPSAIEEILRYESPVQMSARVAAEDVEIGGLPIKRGATMHMLLGAANRDALVFHDAHRFVISRKPNPHLAFATGIHFCLGAPLARLEGQIALEQFIRHSSHFISVTPSLLWNRSAVFRSLSHFHVRRW